MSCFVVTKDTIDRCVAAVIMSQWSRFAGLRLASDSLPSVCQKIGQALWDMNVDAYNARYVGDDQVKDTYKYKQVFINKHQAFKSLECLHYQCSEGGIPDTELFKELTQILLSLAHMIVSNSAEYNAAKWD